MTGIAKLPLIEEQGRQSAESLIVEFDVIVFHAPCKVAVIAADNFTLETKEI
jgi:hypothetical protein